MHLKRKKMIEKQIETSQASILNLQTQVISLEGAQMNAEIVGTLQESNNAFKNLNRQMDPDKVQDVRDELEEQLDMQNEISEAIGGPIGDAAMMDEDDLLGELNEIEAEEEKAAVGDMMQQLPQVPGHAVAGGQAAGAMPAFPQAPQGKVEMTEDEAAMKDLEAMMMAS